ncbi:MAG TPA: glycoside hydrolase family 97 N-terminal domain-containing protein, partial [Chitinophagaceae bacterium]|nr:glycoside hydrolase family 97 N-terminal domain-containing protein [Chitinophagaceae bacterium]
MQKGSLFFISIVVHLFLAAQTLQSPDKQLQLHFEIKDSVPYYSLDYKNITVVKQSKLGLTLVNTISLLDGFVNKEQKTNSFNESWHPVLGELKTIVNNYSELTVTLAQPKTQREIGIRFRLFNDGLGLRYEFPQQPNLNYFVVKEEETQFVLSGDNKTWWIAGDYDTEEYSYTTSNLSQIPALFDKSYDGNASQTIIPMGLQTPLMMKSKEGLYINISEAALIGYPGMNVDADVKNFILKTHLTPDAQGNKGYIQTPFNTPWRTIVVSDKAADILASKLILNLNEPTKYASTNWIKPVKYVGVWWQMFCPDQGSWSYADVDNVHLGITDYKKLIPNKTHAANNANVKKYID